MSELRTRMIDDMTLRGMAAKTQDAYVRSVAGLAAYYHRSPDRITDREVQAYLLHLIRERGLSWSSCSVAVHGLRFFYHQTLGREKTTFHIPGPRKPSKLPEILSREEVTRLFTHTGLPRHRVLLMTAYAAGLRVSEVVHLRVRDIDSERMTIRVEQGKGAQDRYTLLSPRLLAELRSYWQLEHPSPWLFPTRRGKAPRPMNYCTAERIYVAAKQRASIAKAGNIHALPPSGSEERHGPHLATGPAGSPGVHEPLSRALCACARGGGTARPGAGARGHRPSSRERGPLRTDAGFCSAPRPARHRDLSHTGTRRTSGDL